MNSNESCLLPLAYLEKLRAAKNAAHSLRIHARTKQKNDVLNNLATKLASEQNALLKANQKDLDALAATATSAFRDRLALNSKRIEGMIESLNQVIAMDDPVSEITKSKTLDNGLTLKKQRLPLGVVFLIFESRPNVAIESFSLAFKSGNALILRGGKECFHTVSLLSTPSFNPL